MIRDLDDLEIIAVADQIGTIDPTADTSTEILAATAVNTDTLVLTLRRRGVVTVHVTYWIGGGWMPSTGVPLLDPRAWPKAHQLIVEQENTLVAATRVRQLRKAHRPTRHNRQRKAVA